PVLDAGLDLHGVRLDPPLAAAALAVRARLLDHGAVAATTRARLREREQALRLRLDAAAVALRADDGRRAARPCRHTRDRRPSARPAPSPRRRARNPRTRAAPAPRHPRRARADAVG